jgi:hypothetical protein
LGAAHADITLAHIEHRLQNYYSAETLVREALDTVQTLRILRAQGGCERLLAMIGIDTDDATMAHEHAEKAAALYGELGDPWGIVESDLLKCQVCLMQRDAVQARSLWSKCAEVAMQEAEPRQHLLLSQAWLEYVAGNPEAALEAIDAAARVFGGQAEVGDHTPHLVARLARLPWPKSSRARIDAWHLALSHRALRDGEA